MEGGKEVGSGVVTVRLLNYRGSFVLTATLDNTITTKVFLFFNHGMLSDCPFGNPGLESG